MAKTRVAVLFGGQSNEHEISLISASNIIRNIPKDKYEVITIGITKKGRWLLYQGEVDSIENGLWETNPDNVSCVLSPDPIHKGFLALMDGGEVSHIRVDVVFPALHGKNGEDGTVQGLLELAQIPFVGCDLISSANCMDKGMTHIILQAAGIKTAKWVTMIESELDEIEAFADKMEESLTYPMFVKPANCGSSVGISKVSDRRKLITGIKTAFAHDKKVVVEEGLTGVECECAVMGNAEPVASTVGEIAAANEFYDYEAKYQNEESKTFIPARTIPAEKIEKIREIAIRAYKALGCSGLARVDFFYLENGEIYLNEINTMPGHTKISMYPQLMEYMGISQSEQADRLITLALER
ncbi:MAG: D-alanine--D-alanine ligase [Ruminococcus sp.]|nr:D-alanine--D-alanine ligase [Ruminococcus sp.]